MLSLKYSAGLFVLFVHEDVAKIDELRSATETKGLGMIVRSTTSDEVRCFLTSAAIGDTARVYVISKEGERAWWRLRGERAEPQPSLHTQASVTPAAGAPVVPPPGSVGL